MELLKEPGNQYWHTIQFISTKEDAKAEPVIHHITSGYGVTFHPQFVSAINI